jgi:hypothetical protein
MFMYQPLNTAISRSDGSQTLDQYKAAAAKVSNPPAPSVVQGGSIGPATSAPSSPSAAPTSSYGVKSLDTAGIFLWIPVALAGLVW